jgi:hypothetical protein
MIVAVAFSITNKNGRSIGKTVLLPFFYINSNAAISKVCAFLHKKYAFSALSHKSF